jgi:hypothetical protein
MMSKKDAPQLELIEKQFTDLKKAIADLAEAKRVSHDKLCASEFIGTVHELPISLSDVAQYPPLSQNFFRRHKRLLLSGIVGIVFGFVLSILLT